MATITKPTTFSAGSTIIAAEHNDNFDTLYSDYNGNITNINIASGAAIANAKLNLATIAQAITFAGNTTFAGTTIADLGTVTTADINGGTLDGVQIGGTTATGELIVNDSSDDANGLGDQGTSGEFLQSAGAGSNPTWESISNTSNVLFSFATMDCANYTNTDNGLITGTSITGAAANIDAQYWAVEGTTYKTVIATKLKKIAGVSTVTVYARIWQNQGSSVNQALIQVDIGGQTGTVTGTDTQQTPEWLNFTVDVSGLSNGTVYDVVVQLKHSNVSTFLVYMDSIIAFGS